MAAKSIDELFYMISHYDPNEPLGDEATTMDDILGSQYIPISAKIFNAITDLGLTYTIDEETGNASFGSNKEYENQVTAYIAAYLAEVDMYPREQSNDMSAIWASKYMQQALQLIQTVYPDKIEARTVGGAGLVWILAPKRANNISLMIGVGRGANSDRPYGSEPGTDEPLSTDDAYGR